MTSAVLKWLANGLIAVVVVSTLWMAQAVAPGEGRATLVADAVAAPADSASAAGR